MCFGFSSSAFQTFRRLRAPSEMTSGKLLPLIPALGQCYWSNNNARDLYVKVFWKSQSVSIDHKRYIVRCFSSQREGKTLSLMEEWCWAEPQAALRQAAASRLGLSDGWGVKLCSGRSDDTPAAAPPSAVWPGTWRPCVHAGPGSPSSPWHLLSVCTGGDVYWAETPAEKDEYHTLVYFITCYLFIHISSF